MDASTSAKKDKLSPQVERFLKVVSRMLRQAAQKESASAAASTS